MSKKLITSQAILSYPHLDEPQAPINGQGKAKYSASLVFLQGTDLAPFNEAIVEAAVEKFGQGAIAKLKSGALKSPIRTDAEAKGYPEGSVFINIRSEQQPGLVFLWPDPKTNKAAICPQDKITEEFYAGALIRGSITAFAYDTNGNKGVSFGMNNLQKLGNGPRLDGRKAAEDEFEADASMTPADLSDIE